MIEIPPGSTSQSVYFYLRDIADAQAKTGLTASTPGAKCGYVRDKGTAVSIPLSALGSPDAAWTAGGFVEVGSASMPGTYRLDLPDAACAAGSAGIRVTLVFDNTLGEGLAILLRNPVTNTGAGSVTYTVTVQRTDNMQPIAGAQVWISTDAQGVNVIAGSLTTNASGQAVFLLDPGTYFVWVQDEGFNGTNPTQVTVS